MKKQGLANSDLQITPIEFGAWAIGSMGYEHAWVPQGDHASIEAIHCALDLCKCLNWQN